MANFSLRLGVFVAIFYFSLFTFPFCYPSSDLLNSQRSLRSQRLTGAVQSNAQVIEKKCSKSGCFHVSLVAFPHFFTIFSKFLHISPPLSSLPALMIENNSEGLQSGTQKLIWPAVTFGIDYWLLIIDN